MKTLSMNLAAGATALLLALPSGAAWCASRQEAQALVKEAVQYLQKHGRDKAVAEFSNPAGHFTQGDLYIVMTTMDGVVLAHGTNPRLVGKDIHAMKDVNGKAFVQEQLDGARQKGSGWSEFRTLNPVSKVMEDKQVYFERSGDVILSGGIYTK